MSASQPSVSRASATPTIQVKVSSAAAQATLRPARVRARFKATIPSAMYSGSNSTLQVSHPLTKGFDVR
jgi:hypothetical protein